MTNPFRGLLPFEEEHASLFFGRDREIRDIAARLEHRRLLAVTGVSGSGKSSLVRAGVIPILKAGLVPRLGTHVRVARMKPGAGPMAALRQSVSAALERVVAEEALTRTTYGLIDVVKPLAADESLLLLVDQFEEVLGYRKAQLTRDGGAEADRFVALLLRAVEQDDVPISIILTMRSDYLGECAVFRDLPEALNNGHYLTPRMTRIQLQEAIVSPIEAVGGSIQASVVRDLLNRCAEEPDALPVLQHVLRRMAEEKVRAAASTEPAIEISVADYQDAGGFQGAINQDAELVLDAFPEDRPALKRLFQRITEKGPGERAVRKPESVAVLSTITGLEAARLREIIDVFAARDLLVLSGEGETAIVDLPHECLAWKWRELGRWIEQEEEAAARLRFIRDCTSRGIRLTGSALREALELKRRMTEFPAWHARYLEDADSAQRAIEWIDASDDQERAEAEQAIRQQQNTAARELAWYAATLAEDPECSLILGLHSWGKQRAMVPGLPQFVHNALLNSRARLTIQGHRAEVSSVQWSPDGLMLATASRDELVKIWDAESGSELRTLSGHRGAVNDVQWSPDGSRIATAGDDAVAIVWHARTGQELLTLTGHADAVTEVAWSPDGQSIATAGADHVAKVWDAASGRELLTLRGHLRTVWGLAWSPDRPLDLAGAGANKRRLATASRDKTARIWDPANGLCLLTLEGHDEDVYSVTWSPDGRCVATSSRDKTVKVWDAENGKDLLKLPGHRDAVEGIAWSPNGARLATASRDKTARIWETGTGRELLTLQGHHRQVTRIAWAPDGTRVATSSADRTARVWDVGRRREWGLLQGHEDMVYSVAWSPDGRRIATASSDRTARVWDPGSGRVVLTLAGHSDGAWSVAWSPDGSRLATASSDRTARIWDAAGGRELSILEGHRHSVWDVAWSPDGTRLATASRDGTAKIWDARSGRELGTLRSHEGAIRGVAWSPQGGRLATASWDKTARVWDAETGQVLRKLAGHTDAVVSIAWLANGTRLATASRDQTAKVWDAETGNELLTLRGHEDAVYGVAWSPEGSRLATVSRDETTRIWDSDTGRELLTLPAHDGPVHGVAWSPEGKLLATGGADAIAQLYAIDETELLRLVRRRITRNLTEDECVRYLNVSGVAPLPAVP